MSDTHLAPGAWLSRGGGVFYRVWAPGKSSAEAVIRGRGIIRLEPAGDGYFAGHDPEGRAGDLYQFRLGGEAAFPDPASRFQPEGVHGPSEVVDASVYAWRHEARARRIALDDLVLYELHIGTFTPEGTFLAAIERLPALAELGVNAVEIMPLADFPGRWNWGYDGVALYAPSRAYGKPDDLRALVDAAHGLGLSVVLDAVYNHLGPDGNYLGAYTPEYFNPRHKTPWGDGLNFDGPHCGPVRDFFLGNIIYWMKDFRFDGFRLDATHAILDDSPRHILAEIAAAVQESGGFVFAEDERNQASLAVPQNRGGTGLDGLWADDFHHSVRVAITGEREAYLEDFKGTAAELRDTLVSGWHYRGQISKHRHAPRGTPCVKLPPHAFCYCISNHDQVGNRAFGERLSASCSPEAYRAASALLCLSPYTPLLFQGQEWAASTPFLFFTDHHAELGRLVTEGRRKEFKGFAAFQDPARIKEIPDPQAESTFLASKLRWEEATEGAHAQCRALYREALRLRREEPALANRRDRGKWRAGTSHGVVMLRFDGPLPGQSDIVAFSLTGAACEPVSVLTASELLFSSNDARFGGDGACAYRAADHSLHFTRPELVVLRVGTPVMRE